MTFVGRSSPFAIGKGQKFVSKKALKIIVLLIILNDNYKINIDINSTIICRVWIIITI